MQLLRILCLGAGCLASLPAAAIVSMESLHLGAPEDGFSGEVELQAIGASGNTEKSALGAGARLQWHQGRNTDFVLADLSYGESKGERDTNKAFLHLRHIYQFRPRYAFEGFGQVQHNEFTRLKFRGLAGGGARLTLGRPNERRAMLAGLGVFWETETLEQAKGTDDAGTASTWRASTYLVLKYHWNENLKLISSTYYQPDLYTVSDYRVLEAASLVVTLAGNLALKLSLNIAYDSRPPEAVERTDTTYRTSIVFDF